MTKPIGSPKSRRAVKAATKRILKVVRDMTPTEGAEMLGVSVNDLRNMRQGNNLSVAILLKLVKVGRFGPASVLAGPELRKLGWKKNTRGAQQRFVNRRISQLAYLRSGKETAKLTGLSVTGAFGLRYDPDANVTLCTVLGFWFAGHDLDSMIFGG